MKLEVTPQELDYLISALTQQDVRETEIALDLQLDKIRVYGKLADKLTKVRSETPPPARNL